MSNVGSLLNEYSKFADPDPCAEWSRDQLRAELGIVAAGLLEAQREVGRLEAERHTLRRALMAAEQVLPGGDPLAILLENEIVHVRRAVRDALRTTEDPTP